jgi:3-hydroxyacyl-CoA dehydrogenase/enoyl-CoA hydratase/3-hydroxybutyryl-CoA epimerase
MTEKSQTVPSAFSLEVMDNGIGIICIDVPNETMNVLKAEFAEQVESVLNEVKQNKSITGLVLTSGKDNSFVAGADVKVLDACETQQEVKEIAQTG